MLPISSLVIQYGCPFSCSRHLLFEAQTKGRRTPDDGSSSKDDDGEQVSIRMRLRLIQRPFWFAQGAAQASAAGMGKILQMVVVYRIIPRQVSISLSLNFPSTTGWACIMTTLTFKSVLCNDLNSESGFSLHALIYHQTQRESLYLPFQNHATHKNYVLVSTINVVFEGEIICLNYEHLFCVHCTWGLFSWYILRLFKYERLCIQIHVSDALRFRSSHFSQATVWGLYQICVSFIFKV